MVGGPVLDASALLAHIRDETGADAVEKAIAGGCAISTVNFAEALSRSTDRGTDPARLAAELVPVAALHKALAVEPFIADDAIEAARLRPLTKHAGLSLGDRACLALARRLGAVVLTADQAWSKLDLGIEIELIR